MNALMYFGQQTIQANSTQTTISNQEQMNAITYSVNADPLATDTTNDNSQAGGTWTANGNLSNSAYNQFGQHMDAVLATVTGGYNYPINAYPSGKYSYTVAASDADAGAPVEIPYPAGLGTSVAANFNNSGANNLSTTMSNGGGLSFTNKPLLNGVTGSSVADDNNVVFNTSVANITDQSTITLTADSTRPQSV